MLHKEPEPQKPASEKSSPVIAVNDEKQPANPSTQITITYGQLNKAINDYAQLNQASWTGWVGNYLGKKVASTESAMTKGLREILPVQPFSEETQLDQKQLFKLARVLGKALAEKNAVTHQAIATLVKNFGVIRSSIASIVTENSNLTNERALVLFDALCKVPDAHSMHVGMLFAFETKEIQYLPDTIELIVKNSGRIEGLFKQGISMLNDISKENSAYANVINATNLMSFMAIVIQADKDNTLINKLVNSIICAAITHEKNTTDVIFALVWLANHKINTPENQLMINQHPNELSYFPEIGLSTKNNDIEFSSKLFKFAMDEGAKRKAAGALFSASGDAKMGEKAVPVVNLETAVLR